MSTSIRAVQADAVGAGWGRAPSAALSALCAPTSQIEADPAPVALSESGSIVLIQQGAVDLFAVADTAGGRWVPLGRAGAGTALPPIDSPGSGQRVVARPLPGSVVTTLPVSRLTELPGASDDGSRPVLGEVARAIDRGLGMLASAIAGQLPPRTFVALEAGTTTQLHQRKPARSVDGVLWVDVMAGSVHAGEDGRHARYTVGDRICLSEAEFLTADAEAVLRTRSTAELVGAGRLGEALRLHGYRYGYAVARAVEQLVDEEAGLLAGRRERDARLEASTQRSLDGLLANGIHGHYVSTDTEDNATAVLRMVGSRSGVDLPEQMPRVRLEGDDQHRIEQLTAMLGVPHRRVRLAGRWWARESGPLIGYRRRTKQAVALLRVPRGYVIRGAAGTVDDADRPVDREAMRELEVYGSMVYAALPPGTSGTASLLRFGMRGTGRDARRFLVTAVLVATIQLLVPVLTGAVLGRWVPEANQNLVVTGAILVMVGGLMVAALTVVQNVAVLRWEGRLDVVLQSAVWARVLGLRLGFHSRFSAAELATRTLGITAAREVLSSATTVAVVAAVSGLANLALLFFYSVRLGLACTVIMAVGGLVDVLIARRGIAHQRRLYESDQRLASLSYQLLSGVTTLRQSAAESRAYARWAQVLAANVDRAVTVRHNQAAVLVVAAAMCGLATLVAFALAGGPLRQQLGLAGFLSFYTALSLVLAAVQQFVATAVAAYPVVPMMEGLSPVLAAEPEERQQRAQPGELEGLIEVRDVSFRYADGPLVLDGVGFRVERGEFVAVVGATGSGKSTVLRLLLGFEEPESGSILYDGQDMRQIDLRGLRRQCGVVLQSGTLLADDIAANILAGRPYGEEDAWRAAELAGIADDIRALPMGMRTVLAEGGSTLSGGQRQRLMIARALLTSPRILFFDEATSALDNAAQRVVAENTRRLKASRVVIAHRLSTVVDADRIVVLDHGRVVQVGTYEQLASEPSGAFAKLVQRQRLAQAS